MSELLGTWNRAVLLRILIIAAVIAVAALILYPKLADLGSPNSATVESQTPRAKALAVALKSGKPTVMVFHSSNCIPCKEMSSIVADVKARMESHINFIDVVTDSGQDNNLIEEYSIDTIPTSIFFDSAGRQQNRVVGVIERSELTRMLSDLEK